MVRYPSLLICRSGAHFSSNQTIVFPVVFSSKVLIHQHYKFALAIDSGLWFLLPGLFKWIHSFCLKVSLHKFFQRSKTMPVFKIYNPASTQKLSLPYFSTRIFFAFLARISYEMGTCRERCVQNYAFLGTLPFLKLYEYLDQ